ncbi:MAG: hypothetical protein LUD07_10120 [Clostridiales bacterium]|nr:hypothetical protein [Clostridiales bacterium]
MNQRTTNKIIFSWRKLIYYGVPLLGLIFCLWYIKTATFDIVYSDYIRIVNKYLPDVWAKENFFRPDVLTRIPVNYLERPLNVALFHYSTTFEMALGALGLALSALVLARYCDWKKIGMGWYLFLMFLLFGLDKWEMLTNGTGWVHFLAFACFYYHYLVFDRVLYGEEKKWDRKLLLILPPVITLGIAGPYCAVYSVVMVLSYVSVWIAGWRQKKLTGENRLRIDGKLCLAGIIAVVIPLLLYIWSDSYVIEDHDGAVKSGLIAMFLEEPGFFPQFLIRSMASMVVGEETLNELKEIGILNGVTENLLGVFLGIGYLAALIINVRNRLYEKTLVPLMLLFAGMGNHAIVLVSRYIFARVDYGMSSRYALQYQAGLLGIILTFAVAKKITAGCAKTRNQIDVADPVKQGFPAGSVLMIAFCVVLLAGHGYTNYREIEKAPYREAYGERIGNAALQYEILSDDEIRETFDYRKSREESAADVRRALRILKENHWNIFSRVEY